MFMVELKKITDVISRFNSPWRLAKTHILLCSLIGSFLEQQMKDRKGRYAYKKAREYFVNVYHMRSLGFSI